MLAGKNSHHCPSCFIFSMIRGTRASYSCFVYCLLKIQYCLLLSQIHQNKSFELKHCPLYITFEHIQTHSVNMVSNKPVQPVHS